MRADLSAVRVSMCAVQCVVLRTVTLPLLSKFSDVFNSPKIRFMPEPAGIAPSMFAIRMRVEVLLVLVLTTRRPLGRAHAPPTKVFPRLAIRMRVEVLLVLVLTTRRPLGRAHVPPTKVFPRLACRSVTCPRTDNQKATR